MSKTAIITGGAHRLGGQISQHLTKLGYDLAVIYNQSTEETLNDFSRKIKKTGKKLRLYKCDIRNLKELKKTIDNIGKEFKRIELLINNAAIIRRVSFQEIKPDVFNDVMSTNLTSVIFASQYALPYLKKAKDPLIINISSVGGLKNWTMFFPYSVSKTSVIKATYLMAKELAPHIRVNSIAPGTINIPKEKGMFDDSLNEDNIPLRRWGNPEDINKAVEFLIKSTYITGQVVTIDGGRNLL